MNYWSLFIQFFNKLTWFVKVYNYLKLILKYLLVFNQQHNKISKLFFVCQDIF